MTSISRDKHKECSHKKIVEGHCKKCGEKMEDYICLERQTDVCGEFIRGNSSKGYSDYIKKLEDCQVDQEVINLIYEKISGHNAKTVKVNPNVLYSLVFKYNSGLGKNFDPIELAEKMGVSLEDKEIFKLINNTSSKKSPLQKTDFSINTFVIHPSKYIEKIIKKTIKKFSLCVDEEILIEKCKNFSDNLITYDEKLIANHPFKLALVMSHYFINECTDENKIPLAKFIVDEDISSHDARNYLKQVKNTVSRGLNEGYFEIAD